MTERFEPDAIVGGWLRRLATYQFCAELIAGRAVLEMGCGDGLGARFLADQGAARVLGIDPSADVVRAAALRHRLVNLEFRVGDPAALELEDGEFDVVFVADGASVLRRGRVLEELRRVLASDGCLVLAVPSSDRPGATGGASYFELVDRLEPLFPPVQMTAQAPFVGLSLVQYADTDEVAAVELDTSLLEVLGCGETEVTEYVAVCGGEPMAPRDFTIVQVPPAAGVSALAAALGPRAGADADSAQQIAAEALARVIELQRQLAVEVPARSEEPDLRRRLVRAVQERDAAHARLKALKEQVDEAQLEIGRVAGQAGIEVKRASKETQALRARLRELEQREPAPARVGLEPTGPSATELVARAMTAHYEELQRLEQVLEESGAYAEELARERDDLRELLAHEREERHRAELRLEERSAELRRLRSRAATAEGALVRREHEDDSAAHERAEALVIEERQRLSVELAAVRGGRDDARTALAAERETTAALASELEQMRAARTAAEAELAEAREAADAVTRKRDALQAELGAAEARLAAARERAADEVGLAEDAAAAARGDIELAVREREEVQARVLELEAQLSLARGVAETAARERDAARVSALEAEARLAAMRSAAESAASERDAARARANELQARAASASDAAEQTLRQHRVALVAASEDSGALVRELSQARDALTTERDALVAQRDELRSELRSVNKELEAAVQDRARAQQDLDARQQRLDEADADAARTRARLDEVGGRLADTRKQLAMANTELSLLKRAQPGSERGEGPAVVIGELQSELAMARAEVEALRGELTAARGELDGASAVGATPLGDSGVGASDAGAAAALAVLVDRLARIERALLEDQEMLDEIDRATVALRERAAELLEPTADVGGDREERVRALAAELGGKDAEIMVMQVGVEALRTKLRELVAQVHGVRDEMAGRSASEMLEMMEELARTAQSYRERP